MTADVERLAEELLSLPTAMRAFLAQRLIASLDDEPQREQEWTQTLQRRTQDIESGQVVCRPVSELLAELRGKLDAQGPHAS